MGATDCVYSRSDHCLPHHRAVRHLWSPGFVKVDTSDGSEAGGAGSGTPIRVQGIPWASARLAAPWLQICEASLIPPGTPLSSPSLQATLTVFVGSPPWSLGDTPVPSSASPQTSESWFLSLPACLVV